jgi:hypothetical protein
MSFDPTEFFLLAQQMMSGTNPNEAVLSRRCNVISFFLSLQVEEVLVET